MSNFELAINDLDAPLVSVLVYNYNYGRYLYDCLDSVISQTYQNIEIIFSDNASTDDSWDIVNAFVKEYPGRLTIIRNRNNFGGGVNLTNCRTHMSGRYYIMLCSDDVLQPTYVEQCLSLFKKEPELGYVMVHHALIDEEGVRTELPSFYNQSCVIKGEEQAAVYMMAAVNPSVSQVMYNRAKVQGGNIQAGVFAARWYGARMKDFNLCVQYPMGYIKTPLLDYRLHGQNDSLSAGEDILEGMGPYLLIHQFNETAAVRGLQTVTDRFPEAIEQTSMLALRYCVRHLLSNNEEAARRYFYLAPAIALDIVTSELFLQLETYWVATKSDKDEILKTLKETNNLVTRTVSYDPPLGSVCFDQPLTQ